MIDPVLLQHFQQYIHLSPEDAAHIGSAFRTRSWSKKALFIREGEYCNSILFILKGTMRAYSVSDEGIEHVSQIALEGHWISDLYAFFANTPTHLYIEAIEPVEALQVYAQDLEKLYTSHPVLERYFRILFQNAYIHMQQRLNATLRIPAATRYRQLIDQHPAIAQRIPLHYIASYLGITPESLSRIRKQLSQS